MKSMKAVSLLSVALLLVVSLAWSQEANRPAKAQQSGPTSGKAKSGAGQTARISAFKAERLALERKAQAIEARHHALDDEIAAWSESLSKWMKKNDVTIDPARVVLSLSSRSYLLHESQHARSGDPEYSRLEDQMKEIQEKRRNIDADWLKLIARDKASLARSRLKPAETQQTFDFDFGDSTIPIPGVSARQRCCALSFPDGDILHGCKLTKESCAKNEGSKGWHLVCEYKCDPIVLDIR
jgi:hypothetical protein